MSKDSQAHAVSREPGCQQDAPSGLVRRSKRLEGLFNVQQRQARQAEMMRCSQRRMVNRQSVHCCSA